MPKRQLYIQLLFTALAFLLMIILSFLFMRKIVHDNLVRNAESVITFAQNKIETELLESKTTLGSFAHTVRGMILRGDDAGMLHSYINYLSDYICPTGVCKPNVDNLYGYFETLPGGPVFMNSSRWEPPAGFDPTERLWYQMAVAANGGIVETPPYEDMISGSVVISYARSLFDDEGRRLGVVSLNLHIEDIGKDVVEIALNQGGYGMLISQNLMVIAHANPEFVGLNVYDPAMPISVYVDDILAGISIEERPLKNWNGEDTVAFVRMLPNGWYLGLLTPKGPFYQSMTHMALVLILLGSVLTAALFWILIRIDTAKNKSDRESRYKSSFLANMSHEIRTPMNAIIGMTAIGKSVSDSERKDYCFSKIDDASNHLLGVINNILDMSKIEANKLELSTEEFDFEKMFQRIVNVINFRIDEKHQKLMVHIDRAIPKTLVGDDLRLAQVITNLLGNAVKFTPEEGAVSLDARLLEKQDGLCTIQVAVTDTGIGIDPEQQSKLFQSFQQAENSTTRKFGGTGLGLAISKSIVEMMGGNIWIQSWPGKGSTFGFTVQLKCGAEEKQELLSGDINWSNVRIMAVDDDPDVLEYFGEIMNEFGVSCDTVSGGEEALRLVEQNGRYHIYFIDWKMPDMDGISLAEELKAQSSSNSVVIMISSGEWHTIEDEAKKAGVDKFLSKPLFPSAIMDIINESLSLAGCRTEEVQEDITGLFEGRRILLAEDVEINREIVMTLLEPTLLEIDCAENGAEAVRKFSEAPEKYDMIFMDLQMPEMDGYEATRRIRALEIPGAKTTPIVAMTANVFREDVEKCLEAGMDDHIGKPLDFEEALNVLRVYLPQEAVK